MWCAQGHGWKNTLGLTLKEDSFGWQRDLAPTISLETCVNVNQMKQNKKMHQILPNDTYGLKQYFKTQLLLEKPFIYIYLFTTFPYKYDILNDILQCRLSPRKFGKKPFF